MEAFSGHARDRHNSTSLECAHDRDKDKGNILRQRTRALSQNGYGTRQRKNWAASKGNAPPPSPPPPPHPTHIGRKHHVACTSSVADHLWVLAIGFEIHPKRRRPGALHGVKKSHSPWWETPTWCRFQLGTSPQQESASDTFQPPTTQLIEHTKIEVAHFDVVRTLAATSRQIRAITDSIGFPRWLKIPPSNALTGGGHGKRAERDRRK